MSDRWVWGVVAAASFAEAVVVARLFRRAFKQSVWGYMRRKVTR